MTSILIKPHITEKSLSATARNCYTFEVALQSTKHEIITAVEKTFKVNVIAVNTSRTYASKKRHPRTGRYISKTARKFAVVKLAPKQSISLFETK